MAGFSGVGNALVGATEGLADNGFSVGFLGPFTVADLGFWIEGAKSGRVSITN